MADIFSAWNKDKLSSYLVEITANILKEVDADGTPLVDKILDTAGQKGTGRWASESALELGIPLTLVSEAVFMRMLSTLKDERLSASRELPACVSSVTSDQHILIAHLENSLYLAEIISYAQGFMLLRGSPRTYRWELPYSEIANIWRNGCIIRSALLTHIRSAYSCNNNLENLLFDPFFREQIKANLPSLRMVVSLAAQAGVPAPAHASALAFYDGYRSAYRPISFRHNGITSDRILTNAWTRPAENSSILIGVVKVEM